MFNFSIFSRKFLFKASRNLEKVQITRNKNYNIMRRASLTVTNYKLQ